MGHSFFHWHNTQLTHVIFIKHIQVWIRIRKDKRREVVLSLRRPLSWIDHKSCLFLNLLISRVLTQIVQLFQNKRISWFQRSRFVKRQLLTGLIHMFWLVLFLFRKLILSLIDNYFWFWFLVLNREGDLTDFDLRLWFVFLHVDGMVGRCCCPNTLISSFIGASWGWSRIFVSIEGELEHIFILCLNFDSFWRFELDFGRFSLWVIKSQLCKWFLLLFKTLILFAHFIDSWLLWHPWS